MNVHARWLAAVIILWPGVSPAEVTLRAAKAPGGPNLWDQPAKISYLSNSGGESSSSIDAALSTTLPNIPGTTIQAQVGTWIAKNSATSKKQDKLGIEASLYMAFGDALLGYLPELSVSVDRDKIKTADERTYEAKLSLTSVLLNLGGCGHSELKGCTYWNATGGLYSNDVRSSDDGAGIGRVNGSSVFLQIVSSPFNHESVFAPMVFVASAQRQWDVSAGGVREKQNRSLYRASAAWKFYATGAKYKPSIALERVVGSDLLTGQEKQSYTQVALRLEI